MTIISFQVQETLYHKAERFRVGFNYFVIGPNFGLGSAPELLTFKCSLFSTTLRVQCNTDRIELTFGNCFPAPNTT